MHQKTQEERRKSQQHFKGDERRRSYSEGEMPRDPTPGDPGPEASIERDRLDRETNKGVHKSP